MTGKRKWHSLIDKVYAPENLRRAWEKVRANRGAAGVDWQTLEGFEEHLEENLQRLHEELRQDQYVPKAVRRVWIPKRDGRRRPLGVPAVRDRVTQQAVVQVLEPIFEGKFLPVSHGFRPGRSTKTALREVWKQIKSGDRWMVEADIQGFFDTLDHEEVIDAVAEEVADGRVLRLIRAFLKSGVLEEGALMPTKQGVPQGGNLSPLMANVYLHELDRRMSARGRRLVRYADDLVITCRTRREAEEALGELAADLTGMKLQLHPEKSKVVHVRQGFDFLGFTIREGYSLYAIPRKKAVDAFKDRIRELTRRNRPGNLRMLLEQLNPVVRGWAQYYAKAHVRDLFFRLGCWIARRVRAFLAKRWINRLHERLSNDTLFTRHGLVSPYALYLRAHGLSFSHGGNP